MSAAGFSEFDHRVSGRDDRHGADRTGDQDQKIPATFLVLSAWVLSACGGVRTSQRLGFVRHHRFRRIDRLGATGQT